MFNLTSSRLFAYNETNPTGTGASLPTAAPAAPLPTAPAAPAAPTDTFATSSVPQTAATATPPVPAVAQTQSQPATPMDGLRSQLQQLAIQTQILQLRLQLLTIREQCQQIAARIGNQQPGNKPGKPGKPKPPAPTPPTPTPPTPKPPTPKPPSNNKPPKPAPPAPPAKPQKPSKPAPPKPQGSGPVVRNGDSGAPIKTLQLRLQKLGFNPGAADGDFGPKTEAAVKAFQKKHHLKADGVVGKQTWTELGVVAKGKVTHTAAPAGSSNKVINTPDGPMVTRQGHLISTSIAKQFDAMYAAAKRDGVNLEINEAYRSYAEQVKLWNLYGHDPNRVARPGTSNHQKGQAIDFVNTPGAWSWLKANADHFGLHNYPPEAWHYSLTGNGGPPTPGQPQDQGVPDVLTFGV